MKTVTESDLPTLELIERIQDVKQELLESTEEESHEILSDWSIQDLEHLALDLGSDAYLAQQHEALVKKHLQSREAASAC